jgi:pseudaminic acid cytidylyltransferase
MNLCVIPARGGSKRIPRKNIREFCGKPMIAWSIEAAQASHCFDHIIVSTDDAEIADVARHWGAEVPFMRPVELADDIAGTTPVVAHAVQWFMDQNIKPEAVCCLYATAPFVQSADLNQGLGLLRQTPSDRFVFTATTYASPIQRALKINPRTGQVQMWQPENFSKRSQDLEEAYHDAGQFYWGISSAWLTAGNLFEGSQAIPLPRWRVQDIDTEDDWVRAELMHKALLSHGTICAEEISK